MASLQQLQTALVNAHNAGDVEAARRLAGAIQQYGQPPEPEKLGVVDSVVEAVTGSRRRVPETEALPDWVTMPELNELSAAGLKTGLGTLMTNPQETAQVIQANYPGVQIRQDAKGNFILRSSQDGKEYAIKPGFRFSDIPRAGAALAAFTPAGRAATIPGAAAGSAATQAVIEGAQAATGGEFNPSEVVTAGVVGGAVPAAGRVISAGADAAKQLIAGARPAAQVGADAAAPAAAAAAPGAPAAAQPAAEAMAAADLAQTARRAAGGGIGSKRAQQVLAEQAAPDPKVAEAAKRLGIQDYLQPDHVTTSQAYRELAQAVKSIPGSQARSAELEGLEQVGQRAERLIDEIGGSGDASSVEASVRGSLEKTRAKMESQSRDLYAMVEQMVPAGMKNEAPATVGFLRSLAADAGGAEKLAQIDGQAAKLLRNLDSGPVTYSYLDQTRKLVGQAMQRATGPFKDAESGLLKKLYSTLSEDQTRIVQGVGDNAFYAYKAAQYATRLQKGVEDDLVSLFGRNVDQSMLGSLSGAVRALPQGDSARLVRLLKAVPPDLRQTVVASGLQTAFRTAGTRGPISFAQYAKWYEGLVKNKQAYAAIMANLPQPARKQLSDLYRVSSSISAATRERITTGRIQAVKDELGAADNLAERLYDTARRNGPAAAAGAVVGTVNPAAGAAVASALSRGPKQAAEKAVDALITSPEFIEAAKAAGTAKQGAAVTRLARSQKFRNFVRAAGTPREMTDRERWILQSMQGGNQQRQ